MNSLRVLAVEPYYGGSHQAFLESVDSRSQHQWTVVRGPAKHWKWRMRVASLSLAHSAIQEMSDNGSPDVIFCSDMLDLPAWLGMLQRLGQHDVQLSNCPIVTYFHENQWTYPTAPEARVDHHYGYSNLLTAIASTVCVFNSEFHRDSFLNASENFVARMPDSKSDHDFPSLRSRCAVICPGFEPQATNNPTRSADDTINIGWVSRWEFDKRPDRFCELITRISKTGIDFRLVLVGPRDDDNDELRIMRDRFGKRIIVNEFASTKADYWRHLQNIDIVVSTADHEFFGIAICEAIWAGAAPVLPNGLSYPELVGPDDLYDSLDDAVKMIGSLVDRSTRENRARAARQSIERYQAKHTVPELDKLLTSLV